MKNLFNDPKLNEGFQIDFSLLSEEKQKHVDEIFAARGIQVGNMQSITWKYCVYMPKHNACEFFASPDSDKPIIDYATLCRGAVQLEPKRITVCGIEKAEELMRYCGFITHGAEYTQREGAIQFEYRCKGFVHDAVKISPEEFEQRLRGVYPVVAKNETTEKPKYFKSKKTGIIVKWVKDMPDNRFKGLVVEPNEEGWKIGSTRNNWHYPSFEPCDYTEDKPFEFVQDSPAAGVPEPREKFNSLIENENFSVYKAHFIEDSAPFSKPFDNAIEEKIQKLYDDLGVLLKELRFEPIGNSEQLPVYDAEWLNLIVGRYYPIYGVDNNGLVFNDAGDIGNYYLDPKASAGIILAALAKELNGDKVGDEYIVNHVSYGYGFSGVDANRSAGQVLFVDAQKAIDILTQHFPDVLTNYFKP